MKTRKIKLTNFLKLGILLFGISILLWNCNQETIFDEIQVKPLAKVYKFDNKDIPNIASRIENLTKKDIFNKSSKTQSEAYWIDNQNIYGAIDPLGNKSFFYKLYFNNMPSNTFYNIVVTERVNNDIEPFVLAYEFENGEKKSMKYYGLEFFLDALTKRKNKRKSNQYVKKSDEEFNESIDITDCGDLLGGNSGGDSSNNGSGGTGTAGDPNGPTNTGNGNYVSYGSYTVINYGGGSSGGGVTIEVGEGTFTFPPVNALKSSNYSKKGDVRIICPEGEIIIVENVVQIINELTGKARCVYEKLEELSGGFKNAINNFDGEFPVSHLKFKNSSILSNNVNAQTSPPSNYLITIEVNENNLSRPNLSIARTLIHEVIHAEMFRKILSILDNGGDLDGLTKAEWNQKLSNGDYPGIFDYYSRFGVNGMQHEQVAASYRTIISGMLKEFQPNLSQNIYDSLAWEGLKNTISWNSLTTAEKNEITNVITNYNNNGSETCN